MQDKRTQLIKTALTLFYQKGVNSVGINEVLAKSGIAKKTLYHHFASKDDLILACLIYRHEVFYAWMEKCLQAERELANDKNNNKVAACIFSALDDWFNHKVPELGEFKGCFFVNVSAEFGHLAGEISQACQMHKLKLAHLFEQALALEFKDAVTRQAMLNAILLLKEGAINNAYIINDKQAAKKALAVYQTINFNMSK